MPWPAKVFNVLYSAWKLLRRQKFCFRGGRIGALRKKVLEHFTTIFCILTAIFV